jgi:acetyltransferase-like isoleucine patch superfamily enzyme
MFSLLDLVSMISKAFVLLERLQQHLIVKFYKSKFNVEFQFVVQGSGAVYIDGEIENFKIDPTSQLKSGSYVECKGQVRIGKFFHTGRGLTLLSSNHEYNDPYCLPYGKDYSKKNTIIHDFVWCGANVTLLPGSILEDGCIVSAGSVVRGRFLAGSIIAGNPAVVVGRRDQRLFAKQLLSVSK